MNINSNVQNLFVSCYNFHENEHLTNIFRDIIFIEYQVVRLLGSVRLRATSIALQRFETGLVSSSIFCHDLKTKHLELNLLDTRTNVEF